MKKINTNILILFLVIFIDMIGVGIVIPILAPIMLDTNSALIPTDWSTATRNVALGFLIASFPLMQFFGAPIFGSLSDKYGRKKIIGLSLLGTAIGYLLFAIGLLTNSLWLLYVSRSLDGFTGGGIAAAHSSIADMSEEKDKAKNFGLIGMAFGLGFMFGPLIGGVLADPAVVNWFNPALPFWFAAALTTINLTLLTFLFKETLKKSILKRISFFMGFQNINKAFRKREFSILFTTIFLFILGFNFFTQFFPVFLVNVYNFSSSEIGYIFGLIGICIAFSQGVLTRIAAKYFNPKEVLSFSIITLAILISLIVIPKSIFLLFLLQGLIAIFAGLSFPNITTLVSQTSNDSNQGEMLGINQSIQSLARALPALVAGFIVIFSNLLPTLTAATLVLVSWLVFIFFLKR